MDKIIVYFIVIMSIIILLSYNIYYILNIIARMKLFKITSCLELRCFRNKLASLKTHTGSVMYVNCRYYERHVPAAILFHSLAFFFFFALCLRTTTFVKFK